MRILLPHHGRAPRILRSALWLSNRSTKTSSAKCLQIPSSNHSRDDSQFLGTRAQSRVFEIEPWKPNSTQMTPRLAIQRLQASKAWRIAWSTSRKGPTHFVSAKEAALQYPSLLHRPLVEGSGGSRREPTSAPSLASSRASSVSKCPPAQGRNRRSG